VFYKVNKSANPLPPKFKGKPVFFLHKYMHKNTIKKTWLLFIAFFTVLCASANSPQITIVWSTENYDPNAAILTDESEVPLSAGIQGNGDGDLVELGYYSLATTDNPFEGEWVALSQNTRVGDSSTGYGFDDGKFAFTSTFTKDENTVTIFPTEPKVFVETLNFTITSTSPPPGTPICIRFYDSPNKTADTKYNAVTGTNWRWPSFPTGSSVPSNYYWKIASGTPPAGSFWKYGNLFEDNSNPYLTTLSETFSLGVDVAAGYTEMGFINGDVNGTYNAGSLVQIVATPYEHYEFNQWTGGIFTNNWESNTSVLVDQNLEIKAEFRHAIYSVSSPHQWSNYIDGYGPYDYNTTITLSSPLPPEGYEVRAWLEDSVPIAEGPTYTFTISSDRVISPVFTAKEREVTINTTYGGSYHVYDKNGTIANQFYHDQNYTIILSPDPFFKFSGWSQDSLSSGMLIPNSESSLTFDLAITGDVTIEAIFEPQENYLFITGGTGTETLFPESNMYYADSTIQVSATAQTGYQFDYWQDPQGILSDTSLSTTEANISKINTSGEITAIFKIIDYNSSLVDITSSTGGTYFLEADTDDKFSHFSQYSLRAIPASGYQFSHWAGDKNQTNLSEGPNVADNSLIIDGPISLEAVFLPSSFTLSAFASPGEGGYIEGAGGFTLLDSLSVSAQPWPFWEFSGWSGDTQLLVSPDSPDSVIQFPSENDIADINLTALFSRQIFNFTANSEENGEVIYSIGKDDYLRQSNFKHFTVSGGQTTPPYFTFTHHLGETPDFDFLTLHRGETYVFSASGVSNSHPFMIGEQNGDQESDLVSGGSLTGSDGNITVTIPSDFDGSLYYFCTNHSSMNKEFIISDPPILSPPSNSIRNIAHLAFEAEDRITIEGVPDAGWRFKKWNGLPYDEGYAISPTSFDPYIDVSQFEVYADINITAYFERKSYNLTISNVLEGGSSQGQGVYLFEEMVNISAYADPHYEFIEWTGDDIHLLHSDKTISSNSIEIPARDVSLSALFRPKTYSLSASSDDNGSIAFYSIWNEQNTTYPTDINGTSTVVINTTPNSGYVLASLTWNNSSGQQGVAYSNQFIIPSMDGNYSVFAAFKEPPNDLNYSLVNQAPLRGIIEDNSVKASLNQRSFIASSLSNHSFLGWTFSQDPNPSPHWTMHEIDMNVSEGMEIIAHFLETPTSTELDYNITRGNATQSLSGNLNNKRVELAATASENYFFSHWEILPFFDYNVSRNFSSIDPSHSRLFLNGMESPELKLIRGHSYSFTGNFGDNELLYFSSGPQDNYTDRITDGITETQNPYTVIFTVPLDGPDTIYYNGSSSLFSGNKIKIISLTEESLIPYTSNHTVSFPQDTDLTVMAHFSPIELEVSVSESGEGEVVLNQTSEFRYGDRIEFNAMASPHWKFSHWESNAEILTPEFPDINLTIFTNTDITAVFEPSKYILQIDSQPPSYGNAFSLNNKYEFKFGETVSIRAIAKNGKSFVNWSGATVQNADSEESTISISGDTSLVANFEANEYTTNNSIVVIDRNNQVIENETPGNIIGSSTAFDEEIINLSYELNPGYEFLYWRDGDSNVSLSSDPYLSRKILNQTNTEAVVRKLSYQIKVTSYPQNTGSVLWNTTSNSFFEFTAYHGDTINFSSEPYTGYRFKNWMSSSGTLPFPNSKSINFTAETDLQVAAYFEPVSDLVLNIITEPADAGWSVGAGTFQLNETHPILAVPKAGWLFNKWVGNNINDENSASTTINLSQDSTILAQFIEDPTYSPPADGDNSPDPSLNVLIVSPEEPTQGRTTGSGFYDDMWVEISATPSSDYIFSHWQGSGIEDSLSETTRVYVDKDLEITAHFEFVSNTDHILFVSANNDAFGEVFGGGNFRDVWANIRAVPNEGFTFAGWEGQGIIDLFSTQTQIFVNSTKEAVAHFQRKSVFEDSVEIGSGWWESPWFGLYWKSSSSKWTYHSILGWIHIRNKSDNSIWIWIDKLNGWFWSGKTHFPYLYHSSPDQSGWYWLSVERSTPQRILIYKFGESSGWKSY